MKQFTHILLAIIIFATLTSCSTSEELSEAVSEELSEAVSEELSEAVSEELSEAVSEELSEAVSEELSEAVSGNSIAVHDYLDTIPYQLRLGDIDDYFALVRTRTLCCSQPYKISEEEIKICELFVNGKYEDEVIVTDNGLVLKYPFVMSHYDGISLYAVNESGFVVCIDSHDGLYTSEYHLHYQERCRFDNDVLASFDDRCLAREQHGITYYYGIYHLGQKLFEFPQFNSSSLFDLEIFQVDERNIKLSFQGRLYQLNIDNGNCEPMK